jgi:anti-sigma-K factor RskA
VVTGLLVVFSAAVLAGAGLWWQAPGQNPSSTVQQLRARADVRIVPLVGSNGAPAAGGELLLTPDLTQAAVAVHGLPPLPPDRSYQVWFNRPDGTWVSGGVFSVTEQGGADVIVRPPGSLTVYDGCWITEEPRGGSPSPTGQQVLASALT